MTEKNSRIPPSGGKRSSLQTTQGKREVEIDTLLLGKDKNNVAVKLILVFKLQV